MIVTDDEIVQKVKSLKVPDRDLYGRGFIQTLRRLKGPVELTDNQRECALGMIRRAEGGKK